MDTKNLLRYLEEFCNFRGKLAVDGQIINYFVWLEENVQKPSKMAEFWKRPDFDSFRTFAPNLAK